jgi:hypothetical protein
MHSRPKTPWDVVELFRRETPMALQTLLRVMRGKDLGAAQRAAATILDRGWGKPVQLVDAHVTHRVLPPIDLGRDAARRDAAWA